jgi:hypothetical protein
MQSETHVLKDQILRLQQNKSADEGDDESMPKHSDGMHIEGGEQQIEDEEYAQQIDQLS